MDVKPNQMRPFHYIIAIFGSAMIIGCGGASKGAKDPSSEQADYNWADYKGTYAPGAPATKGQSEAPPEPKKEAKASDSKPADKSEAKSDAKESKPASDDAKSMYAEDDDSKPASDDPPKKKKKKKKGGNAGASKSPSAGSPKKATKKRAKR